MLNQYPYPEDEGRRNIVIGVLVSLCTCGIYGLYWKYKQMATINAWLKRDEYSFWSWLFFTIITCGLYGLYYEYKMANSINMVQADNDLYFDATLPIVCVLLATVSLGIASLAIQQEQINRLYERPPNV